VERNGAYKKGGIMIRECVAGPADGSRREEAAEAAEAAEYEMPAEELEPGRLSPRQMLALTAFHRGATLTAAAEAAGVSRQTLHRWRTQNLNFAEAMDVWEKGEMVISRSRIVEMADLAIDTLSDAIEKGHAGAAIIVLKTLRLLKTYKPVDARREAQREAAHNRIMLENLLATPREEQAMQPAQASARTAGGVVRDESGAGPRQTSSQNDRMQAGRADREEKRGDAARSAGELPGGAAREGWNGAALRASSLRERSAPEGEGEKRAGKTVLDDSAGDPDNNGNGKTTGAPASQLGGVTSGTPEGQKTAKLNGKAGLTVKAACYSALHNVTRIDGMLPRS
jgi:hypothetical protein